MEQEKKRTRRHTTNTVSNEIGEIVAFIGYGVECEGKLTYRGNVRIDGQFDGEISTEDTLFIGERAKVTAKISAGSVIACGKIAGSITATQLVEFKSPAVINAVLLTPKLSIDSGVVFNGQITMVEQGAETTQESEAILSAPTEDIE